MDMLALKSRRVAPLQHRPNLCSNAVRYISAALTALLADMLALYLKTKNFHWHVSGPHFRDDHLMLDEQGAQILATTDALPSVSARSVEQLSGRSGTFPAFSGCWITMRTMSRRSTCWRNCVTTICNSVVRLRETHQLCDENRDVATASLIEQWIDEAEGRVWFLV